MIRQSLFAVIVFALTNHQILATFPITEVPKNLTNTSNYPTLESTSEKNVDVVRLRSLDETKDLNVIEKNDVINDHEKNVTTTNVTSDDFVQTRGFFSNDKSSSKNDQISEKSMSIVPMKITKKDIDVSATSKFSISDSSAKRKKEIEVKKKLRNNDAGENSWFIATLKPQIFNDEASSRPLASFLTLHPEVTGSKNTTWNELSSVENRVLLEDNEAKRNNEMIPSFRSMGENEAEMSLKSIEAKMKLIVEKLILLPNKRRKNFARNVDDFLEKALSTYDEDNSIMDNYFELCPKHRCCQMRCLCRRIRKKKLKKHLKMNDDSLAESRSTTNSRHTIAESDEIQFINEETMTTDVSTIRAPSPKTTTTPTTTIITTVAPSPTTTTTTAVPTTTTTTTAAPTTTTTTTAPTTTTTTTTTTAPTTTTTTTAPTTTTTTTAPTTTTTTKAPNRPAPSATTRIVKKSRKKSRQKKKRPSVVDDSRKMSEITFTKRKKCNKRGKTKKKGRTSYLEQWQNFNEEKPEISYRRNFNDYDNEVAPLVEIIPTDYEFVDAFE